MTKPVTHALRVKRLHDGSALVVTVCHRHRTDIQSTRLSRGAHDPVTCKNCLRLLQRVIDNWRYLNRQVIPKSALQVHTSHRGSINDKANRSNQVD